MGRRDDEFQEFYLANLRVLRQLAFRLTGTVADAEDLAQETMVRAYRSWRSLETSPDPLAYARAIMLNRHRSVVRRARVEARHRLAGRPSPPAQRDDGDAGLWQEVMRLPVRQRQALVLHFYADLPQTEIARLLGCPSGTVNSLVYRGLARLRERLAEDVIGSELR